MTVSSASTFISRYEQVGKTVHFQIYFSLTTGGTANNQIRFTLPITPKYTTANYVSNACWVNDTAGSTGFWVYNGSTVSCYKGDASNYGLGSGRGAGFHGFYEVA